MTKPTEQPIQMRTGNCPLCGEDWRTHEYSCKCKPEQPSTNPMIIKAIQGLMHVITNNLEKLPDSPLRRMALDDIGIFEAGVLYKLQEEYERLKK